MPWKNTAFFFAFIILGFLFFGLALDNGLWNSYDFVSFENSLNVMDDPSAVFDSEPPFKFQPLVYSIHYLLFKYFFFNTTAYFFFNILIHGINSFLVYLVVNTLLHDRPVALLSGILFVFTVGSYGKSIMIASGLEDLLITALTLLTMYFYLRNELRAGGKISSLYFVMTLLLFIASIFTRSTSFSILGAFIAFNFFFRKETGRPIITPVFLVLLFIAISALLIKTTVFHYSPPLYTKNPGVLRFIFYAGKNIINYLVRMIFPIHTSALVSGSGPAVRFVYSFATAIRVLIALTVLSYSFFGFIFGNRTIRFFIAWTYIMVLPFAFFQFPYDWLNIRHLYLVSVGFVSVISAGAVFCSRLIASVMWRRYVPFIVPLLFIIMSRFIVVQLDRSYEEKAASANTREMADALAEKYPRVISSDGKLELRP